MRNLIILFLLLFAFQNVEGQIRLRIKPKFNITLKEDLQRHWPIYAGFAVGGALDAFEEVLEHHYYRFERRFPNANRNTWDPDRSWTNKWQGGDPELGEKFPLSSTSLVFLTDPYHAIRMGKNISHSVSVGYVLIKNTGKSSKRGTFWDFARTTAFTFAARTIFFNTVFELF
jgi:hypothetical protein